MSPYLDTSVMLSLHLRDVHFPAAAALMRSARGIVWTPWQKLEFGNAIRTLVARGLLALADVRAVENSMRASVSAGDIVPRHLPAYTLWQEAERLSRAHTTAIGVRTLDLLHVVAARSVRATHFYTFDKRQHALASAAGLSVN
ncbi:MAG: type II toxin-antitoxin system VapC family toxin [Opitutaceae bacterium]|nr:type II toxin-antitoxin system VapC family toxin [Opitutaceae bacterium]